MRIVDNPWESTSDGGMYRQSVWESKRGSEIQIMSLEASSDSLERDCWSRLNFSLALDSSITSWSWPGLLKNFHHVSDYWSLSRQSKSWFSFLHAGTESCHIVNGPQACKKQGTMFWSTISFRLCEHSFIVHLYPPLSVRPALFSTNLSRKNLLSSTCTSPAFEDHRHLWYLGLHLSVSVHQPSHPSNHWHLASIYQKKKKSKETSIYFREQKTNTSSHTLPGVSFLT